MVPLPGEEEPFKSHASPKLIFTLSIAYTLPRGHKDMSLYIVSFRFVLFVVVWMGSYYVAFADLELDEDFLELAEICLCL